MNLPSDQFPEFQRDFNAARTGELWSRMPLLWDRYRWGVIAGKLAIAGPLSDDPFTAPDGIRAHIQGINAEYYDFNDMFRRAAQALDLAVCGNPHGLILYDAFNPNANKLAGTIPRNQIFIVPSRWHFKGTSENPLPALLEYPSHFERVLKQGRIQLEKYFGRAAEELLVFAYGQGYKNFRAITALEYSAHSFAYFIGQEWHQTSASGQVAQLRAEQEHKADQIATLLIEQAIDENTARQVLASQLIMRLTCDLTVTATDVETESHMIAAKLIAAEFELNLPFTKVRDWNWQAVMTQILSRRKAILPDLRGAAPQVA